jgi:hypothetical protein
MPRKACVDAPGAMDHTIVRVIERWRIFSDNQDRETFIQRLWNIVTESETLCFTWTLMPNYNHILLRTSPPPLTTAMGSAEGGFDWAYTSSVNCCNSTIRRGGLLINTWPPARRA